MQEDRKTWKPYVCKKCKTKANRPIVITITSQTKGREFIEEKILPNMYACACGKAITEGELRSEHISKELYKTNKHPII